MLGKNIIITKKLLLVFISAWSFIILSFYVYIHIAINKVFLNFALIEAKTAFEKDIILRRLISSLGGVYVEITDDIKPNPYLQIPNRDVETKNGKKLTLLNPAYLTRLLYEQTPKGSLLESHLTSLAPINPLNNPDDWEKKALQILINSKEKEFYELVEENGKFTFKYLQVFVAEETCLKCHGEDGYKMGGKVYQAGDIRGGISVYLDFNHYIPTLKKYLLFHQISFGIIYIIGIIATYTSYKLINKSLEYFKNEKLKFENLFQTSPLPMAIFDNNYDIKFSNNSFNELFSNVSLKNLKDLRKFCEKSNDIDFILSESRKNFFECTFNFSDKKIKYLKIKILSNQKDNLIIIDDFTDIKLREIEFENLLKVFEQSLNDIYIFDLEDLSINYINRPLIEKNFLPSSKITDIIYDKNNFYNILYDLRKDINFITADLWFIKKEDEKNLYNCFFVKTNYKNKCLLYTIDKNSLKEYEEKFKSIFNLSKNGLMLVNSNGLIEETNTFVNKLGIESRTNISDTEFNEIFKETLKLNNFNVHREYMVNDTTLFLDIKTNKFKINNKVYVLFNISDLTDYKKERDEQDRLKQELFHLQRMEVLGKVTSGIAHEFNNILSIILAYVESIKLEKIDNPQVNEDLDGIIKNIERASTLTKKLLLFSKKNDLNLELINLDKFLMTSSKIFRKLIPANINIKYDLNCPAKFVEIDQNLFFQVILNLLINAKNAIEEQDNKEGEIIISTNEIYVDEKTLPLEFNAITGDYIKTSVTDNGIGIEESDLNKIFTPFFTTHKSSKGVGLGLAIVYSIVKQFKGYITVQSKLSSGTTFDIYLPVKQADIKTSLTTNNDTDFEVDIVTERLKGRKILVVDDDIEVASTITNFLLCYGFDVKHFISPLLALDYIKDANFKPDLLISDYIMPGMNGINFVKYVKGILPDIEMILITGYTEITLDKYLSNVDILYKPLDFKKLLKIITEKLS